MLDVSSGRTTPVCCLSAVDRQVNKPRNRGTNQTWSRDDNAETPGHVGSGPGLHESEPGASRWWNQTELQQNLTSGRKPLKFLFLSIKHGDHPESYNKSINHQNTIKKPWKGEGLIPHSLKQVSWSFQVGSGFTDRTSQQNWSLCL